MEDRGVCFLKFILGLTNWYEQWELTNEAAVKADELGFWGVSMPDHYLRVGRADAGTLESWIALTHLASRRKKIHLGTMVTPIPFRPPARLAKVVASVDVISNGRTFLGIGAGWSQKEFEAYSEWDKSEVRVSKTEEGVALILDLWTKQRVQFQGKYYRISGGILQPKPIQKPHPPLLFGGYGRRMLGLAGIYGDIVFLPPDMEPGFIEAKEIVLSVAERTGRASKLSFATSCEMGGGAAKKRYNRKQFERAILAAEKNGCEYFDFSVPEERFLHSMDDFAKNILSLFHLIPEQIESTSH